MNSSPPMVFSVSSGKGGVGKTNISVNLACCLQQMGKKTMILDADLGLANVDVILGLTPEFNIFHLFHEGIDLKQILVQTKYGFTILPAASGVSDMIMLSTGQKLELLESFDTLEDQIDFLIVDTGAGINDNVMYFNLAVQERIIVLTTEPTSLTDAYALIKIMTTQYGINHFKVLVNMTPSPKEAAAVFTKLYSACDHFLSGVSLDFVGFIPHDRNVRQSVIKQVPFCLDMPQSPAATALAEAAKKITNWKVLDHLDGNIKFFWKKLLFRE